MKGGVAPRSRELRCNLLDVVLSPATSPEHPVLTGNSKYCTGPTSTMTEGHSMASSNVPAQGARHSEQTVHKSSSSVPTQPCSAPGPLPAHSHGGKAIRAAVRSTSDEASSLVVRFTSSEVPSRVEHALAQPQGKQASTPQRRALGPATAPVQEAVCLQSNEASRTAMYTHGNKATWTAIWEKAGLQQHQHAQAAADGT